MLAAATVRRSHLPEKVICLETHCRPLFASWSPASRRVRCPLLSRCGTLFPYYAARPLVAPSPTAGHCFLLAIISAMSATAYSIWTSRHSCIKSGWAVRARRALSALTSGSTKDSAELRQRVDNAGSSKPKVYPAERDRSRSVTIASQHELTGARVSSATGRH